MNTGRCWQVLGLFSILTFAACNGNGEYLRSLLSTPGTDPTSTPGFAHGEVGPDGTPVQRTQYGQAPNVQAGENYQREPDNPWTDTAYEDTSTFGVDVDNGSYTLMRDDVLSGRLPHPDGVRPEEYINYFDYGYPQPHPEDAFAIDMEAGPSPFTDQTRILKIGLQAGAIDHANMRPTNLVFLIDTSGSMRDERKLPLVKESLYTLLEHLRPTDTVGIVTYAGRAGVKLPPTPVRRIGAIKRAISKLSSGGSTNGEGGIVKAYQLAEEARVVGGNNRVVLATDGDFNVGLTGDALLAMIDEYRQKNITITAVGYGRGNFNDATMEGIARKGNGNYFYVDRKEEAGRIFGEDLAATLQVVATDVKVQVEFDSELVRRYRLIGYENRVMANEDFANDQKDAGDIGQGHTVTALYEVELTGRCSTATEEVEPETSETVPLEEDPGAWEEGGTYGDSLETDESSGTASVPDDMGEQEAAVDETAPCPVDVDPDARLATVRLRHKADFGQPSHLQELTLYGHDLRDEFEQTSSGFQFAIAVAEYAEIMRDGERQYRAPFDAVSSIAAATAGGDARKLEFVDLVEKAHALYDLR